MHTIDLRDLTLLDNLVKGQHFTKLTGKLINDFNLDRSKRSIADRLRCLESMGYVKRGFPLSKAITYFIPEEGIIFLQEAVNEK